ncbi:hypothetical protein [Actinocrispum wychmicini]|uniref:Glycosyl transferase family 2 n=1 Tax=Actinocrispum wychmicini TaxID=1213861 RepID=A0A4R2JVP0_9PSEU|nr:hypothetical protein [Actinocrispum wychmicini]TCO61149.1 hypothetical protein EV192_103733 [Actinocrispum wychmicini]
MTATPDIAVIVLCRGDESARLADTVNSIASQNVAPGEHVVVQPDGGAPPGWTVVHGNGTHPADALDTAFSATRAPWAIVTRAGQVLPPQYVAITANLIRTAPDVVGLLHHADSASDYWLLRTANDVDLSTAVWRRIAVEVAGGWPHRCAELLHYALALDVTAAGWQAVQHNARLSTGPGDLDPRHDLWHARSLGIVSLLAGRHSTSARWEHFLLNAELPAKTALYVVDNSGSREFTAHVYAACERIAVARGLNHVDVGVTGQPYQMTPGQSYLDRGRNVHVAGLYSSVFPRVREDLVLTLEDDIAPPLSAVRLLGDEFADPRSRPLGAISAIWDRVASDYICGGRDDGGWGSPIRWDEVPREPMDVGCVGGACTMWANAVLSRQPVTVHWETELGWDGVLCTAMRQHGYRVRVHGGVRCVHHTGGNARTTRQASEPTPTDHAHES